MQNRRTAEEIARLLRDFDRDLARSLTISDICRKVGIAETTYYRWRQRHNPARVDADQIRSDNGSEFVCEALTGWLEHQDSKSIPVAVGGPWKRLHRVDSQPVA